MRVVQPLLLGLPVLAAAQEQVPLLDQVKGWFAKATGSISSVVSAATESVAVPDPIAYGAKKIASLKVERLSPGNYNQILAPSTVTTGTGLDTWLVFVTGGNKTCFGMCGRAETAFNESVPLLAVTPSPPKLAMLSCETDGVLCYAWAVSPPSLLHIQRPQSDQATTGSTVRSIGLNRTTITATEIAAVHIQDKYLDKEPYEGFWHPFDSPLAKSGMQIVVGYAIWGFNQVPSFAWMIGISFLSRTFMGRRMQPPSGTRAAPAPAPQQ